MEIIIAVTVIFFIGYLCGRRMTKSVIDSYIEKSEKSYEDGVIDCYEYNQNPFDPENKVLVEDIIEEYNEQLDKQ